MKTTETAIPTLPDEFIQVWSYKGAKPACFYYVGTDRVKEADILKYEKLSHAAGSKYKRALESVNDSTETYVYHLTK
jgi:hypothetical protein